MRDGGRGQRRRAASPRSSTTAPPGFLVDYTPDDPSGFEGRFAAAVNRLAADPDEARRMGLAGRARAVEEFGWDAVAARTVELYQSLL